MKNQNTAPAQVEPKAPKFSFRQIKGAEAKSKLAPRQIAVAELMHAAAQNGVPFCKFGHDCPKTKELIVQVQTLRSLFLGNAAYAEQCKILTKVGDMPTTIEMTIYGISL